ncbi:hypothetical protein PUN4_320098 [Paraburkholderia unamae]|nr:hypothetical protein PUN4_320098 [Paraburkholderia unamae]
MYIYGRPGTAEWFELSDVARLSCLAAAQPPHHGSPKNTADHEHTDIYSDICRSDFVVLENLNRSENGSRTNTPRQDPTNYDKSQH